MKEVKQQKKRKKSERENEWVRDVKWFFAWAGKEKLGSLKVVAEAKTTKVETTPHLSSLKVKNKVNSELNFRVLK